MIFVGIGANLSSAAHGSPLQTCVAALGVMEQAGLKVVKRSRWRRSAPAPSCGGPPSPLQPWYVNGVVLIETRKPPDAIMDDLLEIEAKCGRRRGERNAPRTLDLDLIAFHDLVLPADGPCSLTLPHPRMHERAFVLEPLAELCPEWRHPVLGQTVHELIAALPPGQEIMVMDQAGNG